MAWINTAIWTESVVDCRARFGIFGNSFFMMPESQDSGKERKTQNRKVEYACIYGMYLENNWYSTYLHELRNIIQYTVGLNSTVDDAKLPKKVPKGKFRDINRFWKKNTMSYICRGRANPSATVVCCQATPGPPLNSHQPHCFNKHRDFTKGLSKPSCLLWLHWMFETPITVWILSPCKVLQFHCFYVNLEAQHSRLDYTVWHSGSLCDVSGVFWWKEGVEPSS